MENRSMLDNQPKHLENTKINSTIPFLGGRPNRTNIISEDEILDLKINLNITKTLDEFLALI
jgi:hypothetical protein